jgi:hypothetical protein
MGCQQNMGQPLSHFIDANHTRLAQLALRCPATYPGSANSATTPGSTDTITTPPMESDKLQKAMALMTKALNKLTNTATTMTMDMSTTTTSTNSTCHHNTPTTGGHIPTAEEAANMTYCWSHGFCAKPHSNNQEEHMSGMCNHPSVGHKTEATANNQLGGECHMCNS